MKNKGLLIGGVFALFFIVWGIFAYINYNNTYVELINLYKAQVSADKIIYDNVWKVVKQEAQISDKYSKDFHKIYVDLMEARNYGGESMKWIQEQNPNFSTEMYTRLMNTIESRRDEFKQVQLKLTDYHREISNLVQKFPGSLFLSGKPIPELEIVTSGKTEDVFNTKKEDDVDLFDKDTTKH